MRQIISTVGTVATEPREAKISGDIYLCSFRLAHNEDKYDKATERWVGKDTNWFTVNVYKNMAQNVKNSFNKGDRVFVKGRLRIRQWQKEERSGTSVEIDADVIGHDLRWGTSVYTKKNGKLEADSANLPAGGSTAEDPIETAVELEETWASESAPF